MTKSRRKWIAIVSVGCALPLLCGAPNTEAQSEPLELLWELGGVDGPQHALWQRVSSGTILRDAIYVVDVAIPSVRQFTVGGQFVAELGRAGAGPGEYQRPYAVVPLGDSIGVWDGGLRRWAIFDADGGHIKTRNLRPFPQIRYGNVGRPFGSVDGFHAAVLSPVVDDGIAHPAILAEWVASDRVDTIATVPQDPLMGLIGGQWNRVSWWGALGPVGGFDQANDSVLLFVDGRASTVTFFERSSQGIEAVSTAELPGAVKHLSSREQERLVQALTNNLSSEWREFRAPSLLPAWSGVFAASEDVLWIRRGGTGEDFGSPEVWVHWSRQDGRYREVTLPPRVTLLDAAGPLVLATRKGDFDETYVRLYRVRPP